MANKDKRKETKKTPKLTKAEKKKKKREKKSTPNANFPPASNGYTKPWTWDLTMCQSNSAKRWIAF